MPMPDAAARQKCLDGASAKANLRIVLALILSYLVSLLLLFAASLLENSTIISGATCGCMCFSTLSWRREILC